MGAYKLTLKKLDELNWKNLEKKLICLGVPTIGLALILKYLLAVNPFANLHIVFFMIMNIFADYLAVVLPNGITVSLNFPIMFCVLILFGPEAAVWVYIPGCLITHLTKKKQPYKTIFNITQIAISIFVTSLLLTDYLRPINLTNDWLRLLIAVLVFDLLNSSLVIKIITLINNLNFFSSFKETWVHEMATVRPIYYAAGVIMAISYEAQGLLGTMLVVAPLLGVFFQLKSQKELKNQATKANTDALTGLANRYALDSWWQQELPGIINQSKNLAVIMLDIDDFKQVNDVYGHNIGDEVLKGVATVLRECVRSTDCIFRFGGEEFVVLLPESSVQGAEQVADRIRQCINDLQLPHLEKITLSVSAGLSYLNQRIISEEHDIPDELIRRADKAMYMAKQNGKNQLQVYT